MYHIVASDLDGTLLSPDHRLTPFARTTLQELVARDVHFVFQILRKACALKHAMLRKRCADGFQIVRNPA